MLRFIVTEKEQRQTSVNMLIREKIEGAKESQTGRRTNRKWDTNYSHVFSDLTSGIHFKLFCKSTYFYAFLFRVNDCYNRPNPSVSCKNVSRAFSGFAQEFHLKRFLQHMLWIKFKWINLGWEREHNLMVKGEFEGYVRFAIVSVKKNIMCTFSTLFTLLADTSWYYEHDIKLLFKTLRIRVI